jgi:hypothetical protein
MLVEGTYTERALIPKLLSSSPDYPPLESPKVVNLGAECLERNGSSGATTFYDCGGWWTSLVSSHIHTNKYYHID